MYFESDFFQITVYNVSIKYTCQKYASTNLKIKGEIIMNKKLLNLGVGLLVGALGGKVLASQTVKKIAVNTVAGGLKIKEGLDKTVENVKVSTEDIIAEAKVKKAEDEKKEAEKKAALDIEEVAEEAK